MTQKNTFVLGVGAEQGIGFQTAQHFGRNGHQVYVAGRDETRLKAQADQLGAIALCLDATDPDAVQDAFDKLPVLDCIVHNVGANVRKTFDEMDAAFFETMWRTNSLSAFNVAKAGGTKLKAQGYGSLLFTSASAAMRGKPGFGAFAATRGGNRMMIQALAKELGPQGVHVAQVVVDGIVNGQRALDRWPEVVQNLGDDGTIDPAAVAEVFWFLHHQPRSAWTHEMDIRPFKESF